ncbi:MAG: FMN-binding protein [Anaerolineae bacterium]|nr:FMN-binding protein [Anaerolineae bacterium]
MDKAALQNTIQFRRARQRRRQALVSLLAFLILVGAWIIGYFGQNTSPQLDSYLKEVLPDAERVEAGDGGLFTGFASAVDESPVVVGYAMVGVASGYGGPVAMLVGTDPEGSIIAVSVIQHAETPNFFRQLERSDYYSQFVGVRYDAALTLGDDIDGVSGATLSADAVAQSIRQAVHGIAGRAIEGAVIPPDTRPIKFGVPEITLIALFVVSFFLHRIRSRSSLKKYGRWAVMAVGVLILGFVLNKPLTIANVISLLAGYLPDWRNNLYWFILLGGIIIVTSVQGKNPYCSWFCPFGATQEFLGSLTGAKAYQPRQIYNKLQWLQRGLSFTAIVLGLALRQPGAASYEPFGTLFNLEGSWPQWVLLIMVLFGSLVIYRPFCNYLCPLDPVVSYVGEVRHWVKQLWAKRKSATALTNDSIS